MQNLDLSQIKKVFFIGIGGIGISALAKMCKARGLEARGLDFQNLKTEEKEELWEEIKKS
jgi:UDP-N-acetylmuramate-alanine ligase